jgi:hypothetical protein
MKKINSLILVCFILLVSNITKAQFNDFLNYPLTVTPHESPDSTRGHFWGYMFGSYYTKLHADSFGRGITQYAGLPKGANAFSLERLYLGYDYFFNSQFSVHAVMAHEENADDAYVANGKINTDANQNRTFYLKYANMEWNNMYNTGMKLSVGCITTPSFAITEEPFWGYRSIDRTIMDMKGITGSNDMGANIGGKIWKKKNDDGSEAACLGFNFMVGNGTGSVPDNYQILQSFTVWKKYYGDIYLKMFNDKLVLDIFGDGRTLQWTPFNSNVMTGRIFLGYKAKNFNISVEYFEQIQKNLVSEDSGEGVKKGGDTVNNIQSGFSLMSAFVLFRDKKTGAPKLSLVARFDAYNPSVNYNPNIYYRSGGMQLSGITYSAVVNPNREKYFVVGFDYQPIKQIHLMPNVWFDGIQDLYYNNIPATSLEHYDFDFVARITFYYQFFKN